MLSHFLGERTFGHLSNQRSHKRRKWETPCDSLHYTLFLYHAFMTNIKWTKIIEQIGSSYTRHQQEPPKNDCTLHSVLPLHLTVPPRYTALSTFGRLRAFSVAGPTSCNSFLPDRLRDPTLPEFWQFSRKLLKTRNYLRVVKLTKRRRDASWFCHAE